MAIVARDREWIRVVSRVRATRPGQRLEEATTADGSFTADDGIIVRARSLALPGGINKTRR